MTQLGSFETVAEALEPTHNRVGGVGGGSPEWYTPPSIIADVREVLGSIDLDHTRHVRSPTKTVRATKWYGIEDDGLSQPWAGRTYLNPPYGSVLPWVRRFFDEPRHLGGCLMLPTTVDSRAGQLALQRCDAVCFYRGRIDFTPGLGAVQQGQSNATPTMCLYRGRSIERFVEVFARRGVVMGVRRGPVRRGEDQETRNRLRERDARVVDIQVSVTMADLATAYRPR